MIYAIRRLHHGVPFQFRIGGNSRSGAGGRRAPCASILAAWLLTILVWGPVAQAQTSGSGASPQADAAQGQPQSSSETASPRAPQPTNGATNGASNGATADGQVTEAVNRDVEQITGPLKRLQAEIQTVEKSIDRLSASGGSLDQARAEVGRISDEAAAYAKSLEPRSAEIKRQLQALGPPPADGAAPEPPTVQGQRSRLAAIDSAYAATIRNLGQIGVLANQLTDRIKRVDRQRFQDDLFRRTPSPLLPSTWADVARDTSLARTALNNLFSDWWQRSLGTWQIGVLLIFAVLLWTVMRRLAHQAAGQLYQWAARGRDGQPIRYQRRAAIALLAALLFALPLGIAAIYLFFGLSLFGPVPERISELSRTALYGLLIFSLASALARALVARDQPGWRIVPIETANERKFIWIIRGLAAIFAIDLFLASLTDAIFAPISLTAAQSVLIGIPVAVLLGMLVLLPVRKLGDEEHRATPSASLVENAWQIARFVIGATAVVVVLASALGYVGIARFITSQILVTGSILALVLILHLSIRSLATHLAAAGTDRGSGSAPDTNADTGVPGSRLLLSSTIALSLNLLLAMVALPLILLQWGFRWADVRGWLETAVFGFDVGPVRISVATIIIGFAILFGGIFLTRIFQRWLDRSVFTAARTDPGLANSIRTGLGYLGFLLSALAAVSFAGIDFTNLAIVAGALSVGIGFGLQSIVNNFVSGLILLVERPIKVGDWVVVGADEGFVRRISVRSTEIETFDRANVIVPNSELISGRVINWTHRNTTARVVVPIGVAYDSDVDKVMRILKQAAIDHPKILSWPEPFVYFENFGASSLDFSLRCFIPNVSDIVLIKTDLRRTILLAFRESGIEIPFPQQDVHLRDLDPLKSALVKVAAERAANKGNGGSGGSSGDGASGKDTHGSNAKPLSQSAGAAQRGGDDNS